VLALRNVSRRVGGLVAVDDVSFDIGPGEVVGLIGPNGAGKSTLVNLVSGLDRPTGGEILYQGTSLTRAPAHARAKMGIARTFQAGRPLVGMTVRDNIVVAAMFGCRDLDTVGKREALADEVLETVGLGPKGGWSVTELTSADRKALELGRALATRPRLMLLDEVMAALNTRELDEKLAVLTRLKAMGTTMLVIEHVMRVVMTISDRVVVLHHGKLIADGPPEAVVREPAVISAYLGS
jgi:branched-chain amino acid transport system ATP-binding protein